MDSFSFKFTFLLMVFKCELYMFQIIILNFCTFRHLSDFSLSCHITDKLDITLLECMKKEAH